MKFVNYILVLLLCSIQVAGHASAVYVNHVEQSEKTDLDGEKERSGLELEEEVVINESSEDHHVLNNSEKEVINSAENVEHNFYKPPNPISSYHKLFILHNSIMVERA